MPLKNLRPITPGTRNAVRPSFEELTARKPEKSLLSPLPSRAGRNNRGRITTRSRGGGSKRMYRAIDFKRMKDDVPAKVVSIEYDPNRTTRIALIHYADGRSHISWRRWYWRWETRCNRGRRRRFIRAIACRCGRFPLERWSITWS